MYSSISRKVSAPSVFSSAVAAAAAAQAAFTHTTIALFFSLLRKPSSTRVFLHAIFSFNSCVCYGIILDAVFFPFLFTAFFSPGFSLSFCHTFVFFS